MKILELFVAKNGRFFEDEASCIAYEQELPDGETPYLYKALTSQEKSHNPKYNQDASCECGHSYYRHFDSYENNDPVGCKYCGCSHFKLATNTEKTNHTCSGEH